jgi:tetratricopeptide (TPR) repeat protein
MADIFNFNLKAGEYLSLADKSFKTADIEKSVAYVRKALEMEPNNIEALQFLAGVYSDLGCYEISNKVLFRAYAQSKSDAQKVSCVAALVSNFYELSDYDTAEYYLNSISSKWHKFNEMSDLEVAFDEDDEEEDYKEGFSLVYPRTEEFYFNALEDAHDAIQDKEYDEALEILEVFEPGVPFYDSSNHLKLVCYLLKNDIDRVIIEAEEMLKITDFLPIRCTLVTAYMLEEQTQTAMKLLDGILAKDYNRVDEITALLPLLVNFDMHADIVKYTKRLLDLSELQPQTMMWLSQGLYNLGQRTEAVKVMRRIQTLFGEFTPAEFYLAHYAKQPEKVEYCLGLPPAEMIDRQSKLRRFLSSSDDECVKALVYNKETSALVRWCFREADDGALLALASKLNDCYCSAVEKIYLETLVTKNVDARLGSLILEGLIKHKTQLNCHVTIEDRCKEVYLRVPEAIRKLPNKYIVSFAAAVYETIQNTDFPVEGLARLTDFVNGFCTLDEKGRLKWLISGGDRAAKFKSARALLCAFILKSAQVKNEDIRRLCDFYGVEISTLIKYLKILDGEKSR